MSEIVVFGAGGRAGRATVAEAAGRGHRVTAVVRDPARHPDLGGAGVTVVAGDVTSAEDVARIAAGHDAAVNTALRLDMPSTDFLPAATAALAEGLGRAGVKRVVLVGIGTTLESAPGVLVHDAPGFPAEYRAFSLGHLAAVEALRDADPALDWVVLAPPPTMLDADARAPGSTGSAARRSCPTRTSGCSPTPTWRWRWSTRSRTPGTTAP
ncbi:NAD(P)-dependent oxidoreductase [Nonomuraea roseoviolacea]|uniref:NADH-flavin reductase n=1 Tax=Nonomuraea roseoviolacea subsp. carminata TaxID=160689 RepID=A0ABT1K0W1_9ACTN|nr:NAD(P)H-binding protein [Nonomuraea roseoviolacea]MCP2347638.1 putative NADH-flavin reductase [Nonomuraea roseoviolacea subsp. carminata]